MATIAPYWQAVKLQYGTVGIYGLFQRAFIVYGVLALSGSFLIDAPFGRFGWNKSSSDTERDSSQSSEKDEGWLSKLRDLTVPGNIGWLIMEIFSPLTFLVSLSLSPSSSPLTLSSIFSSLTKLPTTFLSLAHSRQLLIILYLIHYLNRSILSSLIFNPGRAPMHFIVPLAAVIFNIFNGFLLGCYLGGGVAGETGSGMAKGGWGLESGKEWLFVIGILIWTIGFAANWYSDEILYSLKRSSHSATPPSNSSYNTRSTSTKAPNQTRYSVPHGFLYSKPFGGISHPAYFTEWLEWTGFLLATLALTSNHGWPEGAEGVWSLVSDPHLGFGLEGIEQSGAGGWGGKVTGFLKKLIVANLNAGGAGGEDGTIALGGLGGGGANGSRVRKYLDGVPEGLWPLKGWYLQPPALFLWNEIAAMLPRAISGHEWYKKTFGDEFPKERKAVLPGLL